MTPPDPHDPAGESDADPTPEVTEATWDDAPETWAEDEVHDESVRRPRTGMWALLAGAGMLVGIAGLITAVVIARTDPPQVTVTAPAATTTTPAAPLPSPATVTGTGEVRLSLPSAGVDVVAVASGTGADVAEATAAAQSARQRVQGVIAGAAGASAIRARGAGISRALTLDGASEVTATVRLAARVQTADDAFLAELTSAGASEVTLVPRYGTPSATALAQARAQAQEAAESQVTALAADARRRRGVLRAVTQQPSRADGDGAQVVVMSVTYTLTG